MVRYGGLRDIKMLRQAADALLSILMKEKEDVDPELIGQGLEAIGLA
jgi:hypothetical protein